jgi:glycosyltransferase involved in cell wall biosynthesis
MKICLLGLGNLSVLAPDFSQYNVSGEEVQHVLLAKALTRLGHTVSMVVYDLGQSEGACWNGVVTHKAYAEHAGIPVLRYVHPRGTGIWSALRRANADVYYVSCAGMHLGLVTLFCKAYGRKCIFKVALDTDCDPDNLMIQYWRDKKLYEYGLRHANGILVQSLQQQQAMLSNYGLRSQVAEMLVDMPDSEMKRNVDVLWVNNLLPFKRPDLFLALAKKLPQLNFHMVGGPQVGHDNFFEKTRQEAASVPNLTFHGRVPYQEMGEKYASARVFVNTSDVEGFPNSYLQAWIRGTPVITFFDPDAVIQREQLGWAVSSLDEMANTTVRLTGEKNTWLEVSKRCRNYMKNVYDESRILKPYLEIFQRTA